MSRTAGPSRRNFLKLGAAAMAGASATPGEAAETVAKADPAAALDHLVVIMFENRSFDNLLGHLYPPQQVSNGQSFDGVGNGGFANPSPSGNIAAHISDEVPSTYDQAYTLQRLGPGCSDSAR